MTYPHLTLAQTSVFVTTEIKYNQLTYEQFLAGEISTINRVCSQTERLGRLRLLQHVAHWKLRPNVTWPQLHNVYAIVLRDIENDAIGWSADFNNYQYALADKITSAIKSTKAGSNWFCKQYQKIEGCTRMAPHQVKFGNTERIVHHFCAKCWIREKTISS